MRRFEVEAGFGFFSTLLGCCGSHFETARKNGSGFTKVERDSTLAAFDIPHKRLSYVLTIMDIDLVSPSVLPFGSSRHSSSTILGISSSFAAGSAFHTDPFHHRIQGLLSSAIHHTIRRNGSRTDSTLQETYHHDGSQQGHRCSFCSIESQYQSRQPIGQVETCQRCCHTSRSRTSRYRITISIAANSIDNYQQRQCSNKGDHSSQANLAEKDDTQKTNSHPSKNTRRRRGGPNHGRERESASVQS